MLGRRISVDSSPRSEPPSGSYLNPSYVRFQFTLIFLLWDPQDGDRLSPRKDLCQFFSVCPPPHSQHLSSKQTLSAGEVTLWCCPFNHVLLEGECAGEEGEGGRGFLVLHREAEHDEAFFFPFKDPGMLQRAGGREAGLQLVLGGWR